MKAKGIPAKKIAKQINVSEVHLSRLGIDRKPPPQLIKAWMNAMDYKPSQTEHVVHLVAGLKADRRRTHIEEKNVGIDLCMRRCEFLKGKSFDGVSVFLFPVGADKLQGIIVGIECSQGFVFFIDGQTGQETTLRNAIKTLHFTGQKGVANFILTVFLTLIEQMTLIQLGHLEDDSGRSTRNIIQQSEVDEKTKKLATAIQIFRKHIFPSSTGDWFAV